MNSGQVQRVLNSRPRCNWIQIEETMLPWLVQGKEYVMAFICLLQLAGRQNQIGWQVSREPMGHPREGGIGLFWFFLQIPRATPGTSDKIIILDQAQVNDGSNYEYPGQTLITPVSEEIKEYWSIVSFFQGLAVL